jgi:hypothetical protein
MKRYAIVVERADRKYTGYVPDLRGALQRVSRLRRPSAFCANLLKFMSPGCGRTGCRCPSRPACSITWRFRPNKANVTLAWN